MPFFTNKSGFKRKIISLLKDTIILMQFIIIINKIKGQTNKAKKSKNLKQHRIFLILINLHK